MIIIIGDNLGTLGVWGLHKIDNKSPIILLKQKNRKGSKSREAIISRWTKIPRGAWAPKGPGSAPFGASKKANPKQIDHTKRDRLVFKRKNMKSKKIEYYPRTKYPRSYIPRQTAT
jgi:hypothetical protein